MWPAAGRNGTEKSESASYLSFLGTVNVGKTDRELVGAEGLHKHDEQIRDLSINQAVTTCSLAN